MQGMLLPLRGSRPPCPSSCPAQRVSPTLQPAFASRAPLRPQHSSSCPHAGPAGCSCCSQPSSGPRRRGRRPAPRSLACQAASVAHPAQPDEGQRERSLLPLSLTVPTTAMAKSYGSHGGAVLERKKVTVRQKMKTEEPKLDMGGGSGGIGKILFNGGGGDDDGGDDDDYFKPGGSGDGDGKIPRPLLELYDPKALAAVLTEWGRTIGDIPAFIRMSVEMGAYSSAQLWRFLTLDTRPNITRSATRLLPDGAARGVVGRLMADPAFAQKMLIEQLFAAGASLYWEYRQRGERFWQELDLVAINTLSLAAAQGALVWLVAPSRSFGTLGRSQWSSLLHNLPHNVFDASTPVRRFSLPARFGGLAWKSAELAAIGAGTGAVMSGLGQAAVALRQRSTPDWQPAVPVPQLGRSVQGMALSLGIFSNLRYQAISGVDRLMFDRMSYMWAYLGASSTFRAATHLVGQPTRLFLQGLPTEIPPSRQEKERAQRAEAMARLQLLRQQWAARQQGQQSRFLEVEVDSPYAGPQAA